MPPKKDQRNPFVPAGLRGQDALPTPPPADVGLPDDGLLPGEGEGGKIRQNQLIDGVAGAPGDGSAEDPQGPGFPNPEDIAAGNGDNRLRQEMGEGGSSADNDDDNERPPQEAGGGGGMLQKERTPTTPQTQKMGTATQTTDASNPLGESVGTDDRVHSSLWRPQAQRTRTPTRPISSTRGPRPRLGPLQPRSRGVEGWSDDKGNISDVAGSTDRHSVARSISLEQHTSTTSHTPSLTPPIFNPRGGHPRGINSTHTPQGVRRPSIPSRHTDTPPPHTARQRLHPFSGPQHTQPWVKDPPSVLGQDGPGKMDTWTLHTGEVLHPGGSLEGIPLTIPMAESVLPPALIDTIRMLTQERMEFLPRV